MQLWQKVVQKTFVALYQQQTIEQHTAEAWEHVIQQDVALIYSYINICTPPEEEKRHIIVVSLTYSIYTVHYDFNFKNTVYNHISESIFGTVLVLSIIFAVCGSYRSDSVTYSKVAPKLDYSTGFIFRIMWAIWGLILFLLDLVVIVEVLQSCRNVCGKVLWICAILMLPVLGTLVYFCCGDRAVHRHSYIIIADNAPMSHIMTVKAYEC